MSGNGRVIEDGLFLVSVGEFGWCITHKGTSKKMGINFKAIPKDSSDDYVLGYAKCLAYQEGVGSALI